MLPLTFYIGQFTPLPKAPTGDLLKGKNVIITGANTGLGLEAAKKFAKMSPKKLIITARNMKAGAEALDQILKESPGTKVDVWELDLAKYSSIKALAQRAEKELGMVDLLMNNAGVNFGPEWKAPSLTEDGHEASLQTNALAPVLILFSLLPCLQRSSDPKVVFTTSEVHSWTPAMQIVQASENSKGVIKGMDEIPKIMGFMRYMDSKLLLQMAVRNLIQALPNVKIFAVNPGLCATSFGRHFHRNWMNPTEITQTLYNLAVQRSPELGSRNLVFAAVGDFDSSEYFDCCAPAAAPSPFTAQKKGMEIARKYWGDLLEEVERVSPGSTKSLKQIYV